MILESSGATAHGDTLCHDVLPGSFRAVTLEFCRNTTSTSSVEIELNFARKLGISSLCFV